jgi:hypothetical protein
VASKFTIRFWMNHYETLKSMVIMNTMKYLSSESEEKLGKNVEDGNRSGGEEGGEGGGGGGERVLWENI